MQIKHILIYLLRGPKKTVVVDSMFLKFHQRKTHLPRHLNQMLHEYKKNITVVPQTIVTSFASPCEWATGWVINYATLLKYTLIMRSIVGQNKCVVIVV